MSVSMAWLLPGSLGSVVPAGARTTAKLIREPVVNDGLTRTVKVKTTAPPTGRSTVVARGPLPMAGPVTLPPPVLPVASQELPVMPSGRESKTVAPVTASEPLLLTTMV